MITKTREKFLQERIEKVFGKCTLNNTGAFFSKRFFLFPQFLCQIDLTKKFDVIFHSEEKARLLDKQYPLIKIAVYPRV